jgi:hypothetical protein
MDAYMADLQKRWNILIDPTAQKNLLEDVNSLVRDKVRPMLRIKHKVTADSISQLAETTAKMPALSQIRDQEALQTYIKLYITKLL